jgi:hypothetical protein
MGRTTANQKVKQSFNSPESYLKTIQVIDSIKTFVLPMSEFLLRHSNLSLTKLQALDGCIRQLINKKIGSLPLTKEAFYVRPKEGYFGLYSLKNRYHICKIANMGHLLSSEIGGMMRRYITQVALDGHVHTINDIDQIPNSRFFTWRTNAEYYLGKMQGAVHCEIYEAFKACKMLNIGINYAKDQNS